MLVLLPNLFLDSISLYLYFYCNLADVPMSMDMMTGILIFELFALFSFQLDKTRSFLPQSIFNVNQQLRRKLQGATKQIHN